MTDTTAAQMWAAYLRGQKVGDYTLGDRLGDGHFSVVLEGIHQVTGAGVAVKVLLPSQQSALDALDFEQEGRLLRKLVKCSNVISLIDTGTETVMINANGMQLPFSVRYHVMPVASGTLQELIEQPHLFNTMSWLERVELWRAVVLGVHQMHLKSVAHRDLKASNCLLMVSGARTEVRLSDFGRGRDLDLDQRFAPQDYAPGRGDLNFAPPEFLWHQGRGDSVECKNADLYGLGSLFYEIVTGQPITGAALGSVRAALIQGQQNLQAGRWTDLAVLRPQYRFAMLDFEDRLPPVIRHQATALVTQLCDPIPENRQPRSGLGRRREPQDGLQWLLWRTDILRRRISTAQGSTSSSHRNHHRSA